MTAKKNRKLCVLGLLVILFLIIPVTAIVAEIALKGDPTVKVVSTNLRVPKEIQELPGNTTLCDAIYYLDVILRAEKHPAEYVNGTLKLKDNLEYKEEHYALANKNLSITKNFITWTDLTTGIEKNSNETFIIRGLNVMPKTLVFELELVYINPNDEQVYSKTQELTFAPDSITLDIISVSSPANYYKGFQVVVNIKVKNTGSEPTASYGTFKVYAKSIKARDLDNPYENTDGDIILLDIKVFSTIIYPLQTKTFIFPIDYSGYSNGALNVGEWKICQVDVIFGDAQDSIDESQPDYSQHINDPNFIVLNRSKTFEPHPVFIYYIWNAGGDDDNWDGVNPKSVIEDGGGTVSAGLWRFGTYDSNIPVKFNMIISCDDSTWEIPESKTGCDEMAEHGVGHAGTKLKIIGKKWKKEIGTHHIHRYNCGFDVLLMVPGRRSDNAGGSSGTCAIACRASTISYNNQWQKNLDGVVQHEISHIFYCDDHINENPLPECIMAYKLTWIRLYHTHEVGVIWHRYEQIPNWCSDCVDDFNDEWETLYEVVEHV